MADGKCANAPSRRILTRLASSRARISATRTMEGAVGEVGAEAAVQTTETMKGEGEEAAAGEAVAEATAVRTARTAIIGVGVGSAAAATIRVVVVVAAATIKGAETALATRAMVGTTAAARTPTRVIARLATHSPTPNASNSSVKIRFESCDVKTSQTV